MVIKTIVIVIVVLAMLEGLFATLAPEKVKGVLRYFIKKSNGYFRKFGIFELIIAIIVFVLVYYYL